MTDAFNTTRRVVLKQVVTYMLLALLLAFVFVLLSSLGISLSGSESPKSADKPTERLFADVAVGETVIRRGSRGGGGQQRVWVSRLSKSQRLQAEKLTPLVSLDDAPCDVVSDVCVLSAATARDGIELYFTDQVPASLPSDLAWAGGFVDPSNGHIYDRLGRAYLFQNIASLKPVN